MTTSAAPCSRCGGFQEYNDREKDWTCINCGHVWSPHRVTLMEEHEDGTAFWQRTRPVWALAAYREARTKTASRRRQEARTLRESGHDFEAIRQAMGISESTVRRYLRGMS